MRNLAIVLPALYCSDYKIKDEMDWPCSRNGRDMHRTSWSKILTRKSLLKDVDVNERMTLTHILSRMAACGLDSSGSCYQSLSKLVILRSSEELSSSQEGVCTVEWVKYGMCLSRDVRITFRWICMGLVQYNKSTHQSSPFTGVLLSLLGQDSCDVSLPTDLRSDCPEIGTLPKYKQSVIRAIHG
jgi:hypothetical protein